MATDQTSVLNDPRVTNNADGTVSVQLSHPVSLTKDGEPLASITLGPLNGQAMVDMINFTREGDRLASLIRSSSGMAGPKGDALIKGLSGFDFLFVGEVASTFLGSGQTTGQ
ncbi:hypothetical protein [Acetobacter senegalensis]|uniref:hypothetical protein n=1 Tax=Acetobacter senegalensis TaxID=446692 RepID=UPI00264D2CF4|nr:hypothetical protein [Acetobacter senegalensis]MDN7351760.1 hypothetical protein [Acetobacter senegalensis]